MSGTELFGIVAVTVMVIAYALEDRGASYVLVFCLACLAAALYAVRIKAWPFAVVETVWSVIAFRRWLRHRFQRRASDER